MILPKIVDIMQRIGDSGVFTDSSRFDRDFYEDAVHKGRASVLLDAYSKIKRINPIWTQQFVAKYEPDLQDDNCLVRFKVPAVLTLNYALDGFLYVGSTQGNCQYRKMANRADLANSNGNRYTRIREDQVKFIYSDGFIECYGNTELRDLRVDGIFLNPTEVPTYNKQYDEYPLDEALILQLESILFNTEVKPEITQPGKVKNQNASR